METSTTHMSETAAAEQPPLTHNERVVAERQQKARRWLDAARKRGYVRGKRDDRGFTLVEIGIAILVIGALGALGYFALRGLFGTAQDTVAEDNLNAAIDQVVVMHDKTIRQGSLGWAHYLGDDHTNKMPRIDEDPDPVTAINRNADGELLTFGSDYAKSGKHSQSANQLIAIRNAECEIRDRLAKEEPGINWLILTNADDDTAADIQSRIAMGTGCNNVREIDGTITTIDSLADLEQVFPNNRTVWIDVGPTIATNTDIQNYHDTTAVDRAELEQGGPWEKNNSRGHFIRLGLRSDSGVTFCAVVEWIGNSVNTYKAARDAAEEQQLPEPPLDADGTMDDDMWATCHGGGDWVTNGAFPDPS